MSKALHALRPEMLERYAEIASLVWKYADRDLIERAGLEEAMTAGSRPEPAPEDDRPAQLAEDLEEMGPTFIKLGQLLSTRSDLLPRAYRDALAHLQDDVEPCSFGEIEDIVQESLGVRPSKAFAEVDARPHATASLAQVHRARLRDGREVVLKVQRPGIREQVEVDLEALDRIAGLLDRHSDTARRYRAAEVVEEFRRTLLQELDFQREAANLRHFREALADFPLLTIPAPIDDYVAPRVLVMEYVHGTKLTDLSGVVHTEIDGPALIQELFRGYLHQVLVDGTFHADPHPGNVLLTPEHEIALLDLGMVGHFHQAMQRDLIKLLLALAEARAEDVIKTSLRLAETRQDADVSGFRREIEWIVMQNQDVQVEDLQLGQLLMGVTRQAAEHGILLPPNLSVLGKTLLNLDEIARCLAPDFDPQAAVREYTGELLTRHMREDSSSGSVVESLMEAKELAQQLPGRTNQILELLAENKLRIRVDAVDERQLLSGIEKVANRITAGLVLAALIVGAAMLMNVDTDFTILGYPGLAMLLFLAAAFGGFLLVYRVLKGDDQ